MCFWAVQNLARVSNEVSNDDLGTHVAAEAAAKSTTFVLWYGAIIKSDNLQYNTLARWVDGTNDSLTKHLMFQALFFFHNFL